MPRTAARFIVIPPRVEPYQAYALEGDCLCASERLILSRVDSSIGPRSHSACRYFRHRVGRESAANGNIRLVTLLSGGSRFRHFRDQLLLGARAAAGLRRAGGARKKTMPITKLEKSPWLLAPVFSSNPKLGTSVGALAGYLHSFDEKSRPSIFALSGQYTSTDSIVAGAIARASWDEDHHRLIAGLMYGNIKNDYDDYLGTGVPLRNERRAAFARRALHLSRHGQLVSRRAGDLSELRHRRPDAVRQPGARYPGHPAIQVRRR